MKITPAPTGTARPLVVFSGGLGAVEGGQDELGRFLASHGFVVVVLVHPEELGRRDVWGDERRRMLEQTARGGARS